MPATAAASSSAPALVSSGVVPFSSPVLQHVVARSKLLDLRVGSPMICGHVYTAVQSGLQCPVRVVDAIPHASVADVWTYVQRSQEAQLLFPDLLQKHYDIAVTDAASASQLFNKIRRRPPSASSLTLYRLEPLDPDTLVCDADGKVCAYKATPSMQTAVDAICSERTRAQSARAMPPSLSPPPLPPSPLDSQRVYLVACRRIDGTLRVLARREGTSVALPSQLCHSPKASAAVAAAERLCQSVLRAPPPDWRHAPPHLHTCDLPLGRISAVAVGSSSLPAPLSSGSWVWVPASDYAARTTALDSLVTNAIRHWAWQSRSTPLPREPVRRRPRSKWRSKRRCSPESHSKLGRVPEDDMAAQRTSRIAHRVLPPHLANPSSLIQTWHRLVSREFTPSTCATIAAATTTRNVRPVRWSDVTRIPEEQPEQSSERQTDAVIAAAMLEYHETANQPQQLGVDVSVLERIMEDSKRWAKSRGATTVTPRDVAEAARSMDPSRTQPKSPADVLPEHYDELISNLAALRRWVDSHVQAGGRRPRVLVAGERHSVVAKMFLEAGAEVATTDLHDTDTPAIPHFKGDMNLVLDLGWDLVVGHPPCTYLSNVAVAALYRDRSRVKEMNYSADLFRRVYHADAPFVAVENPTMHRHGRRRAACGAPTQYVQPFEHGTGHQKRTGFHTRGGLPLIQPTRLVDGRERPMANLPDVPNRSDMRSRTYVGVAGAMALQWMPTLMTHVIRSSQEQSDPGSRESAHDLIQKARAAAVVRSSQIWFVRRQPDGSEQLCLRAASPLTGSRVPYEHPVDQAGPDELSHRISSMLAKDDAPAEWKTAALAATRLYPDGHHRVAELAEGSLRERLLWKVEITENHHLGNSGLAWVNMSDALHQLTKHSPVLGRSVSRLVGERMSDNSIDRAADQLPSASVASAMSMPRSFRPWLKPPPSASLPVPSVPVSKIHYAHRKWRAWEAIDNTEPPQYAWSAVPEDLGIQLSQRYRPVADRMLQSFVEEPYLSERVAEEYIPHRREAKMEPAVAAALVAANEHNTVTSGDPMGKPPSLAYEFCAMQQQLSRLVMGEPPPITNVSPAPSTDGAVTDGAVAFDSDHAGIFRAGLEQVWDESERILASYQPGANHLDVMPRLGLGADPLNPPPRREPLPRRGAARRQAYVNATGWVPGGNRVHMAAEQAPGRRHASKVWFAYRHPQQGVQLASFYRSDSRPGKPQRDTFGGSMDLKDEGSYHTCMLRELSEECGLHPRWQQAAEAAIADPSSSKLVELNKRGTTHHMACYVAWVDNMFELPELRDDGVKESIPGSLEWTSAKEVLSNLGQFEFARPHCVALRALLGLRDPSPDVTATGKAEAARVGAVQPPDERLRQPSEILETPRARNYHQCLYTQGVTVCRKATGERFWIDCALTESHKTLADTGAAPSITTTGLLAMLPRDALILRDHSPVDYPVEGPDGGPLVTRGFATITFAIDDQIYRHRFMVVEGKPLMIFGQDFLAPWKATLELNASGNGQGFMKLGDHSIRITSNAADLKSRVCSVASNVPPPSIDGVARPPPAMSLDDTGETEAIHADSELTGLAPAEVALKRLTLFEGKYMLYTSEAVVLPPMTKRRVFLQAPAEVVSRGDRGVVVPAPQEAIGKEMHPHVEVGAVTPDAQGKVPVVFWNTTRRQMVMPAFTLAAALDTEYVVHDSKHAATGGPPRRYADLGPEHKGIVDKIGEKGIDPQGRLRPEQRAQVLDLLAEFVDIFSLDPKDPKHTHLMEVHLQLKPDAVPHRHAPSRLGPEGQKIVDQHIDDMESRNIIRKSNSAWGSRVVLVTKSDGSIRFCVDFRDTNSKLVVMDSPIPLTAEAIDRLASGQGDPASLFLSMMDLSSGFWCLPMRECDKALTSFVTHRGKYEFNYLPFGIQCGPSYMCRLMDAALQGLAWDICMPYLDDTATWSTGTGDTFEDREESSFLQMMERLRLVFERFRWAQLSCKPSKCEFFATSAAYLGHVVGRAGLSMDPKKISAINEIDTTLIDNVSKVRSFLGLASYYRRFIKGFASIAAPLHDLTLDGVDVAYESQSEKAQNAMKELIKALVSEPVLTLPRFDRQFIVKTDAAVTEGIGGVLSQHDDDKKERVNSYYGRRLRKAERNWTVTEVELLAALESIRNWRPYLWGREFRLVVDHSALRWLHTMRDTFEGGAASRLMRWIMKLQEYRFTVEHKPGINHNDADGVSRLAQRVAALLTNDESVRGTEEAVRRAADPSAICAAVRRELDEWAQATSPSGPTYDEARTQAIDKYWWSQYWERSATVAPAMRKPTVTARRLQDASRRVRNLTESRENILKYYLGTGAPSLHAMQQMQQEDEDCRYLADYLVSGSAGQPSTLDEWKRVRWALREVRHLELHDGVLYRRDPTPDSDGATDRLRVYVPVEAREAMLVAFHDHFGHRARNPMERALKLRHYWPGMAKDVDDHCARCHECTLGGHLRLRNRRPRGPKLGHYPFDLLYVDMLDMAPTHDFEAGITGYDKLLVFVDSLTRWVEAIPFNGDPTSEQVLDAFMAHVVSRHGCPRTLRSDLGSNLASDLSATILEQTGCNLRPSTAEHHESVGAVERFNGSLSQMVRIVDEGGLHWADHLPFLLMSYRATPHRVTKLSPAALLYGRELRVPAQIDRVDTEALRVEMADQPDSIRDYALRLHDACVWSWQAATEATLSEQGQAIARDAAKSYVREFTVGDRVARLLPDRVNKLKYLWSGPYRIDEVMADNRYRLRDLENRLVHNEFDSINLRPYRTVVDADELAADEYVIDRIDGHRDRRGQREFRVKWRGYPVSQNTWEPRAEIERRAASLIEDYEKRLGQDDPPAKRKPKLTHKQQPTQAGDAVAASNPTVKVAPPTTGETVVAPPTASYESDDVPSLAKFERGQWFYGLKQASKRGSRVLWHPEKRFVDQLESDHFASLRAAWLDSQGSNAAAVAALIAYERSPL